MILGEMYILSLICSSVAVCRFCAVGFVCVIIICFFLLFSNYSTYVFLIFFLCLFPCFVYLFSNFCIPCYFIVLCAVSPFVYSCLFPIFMQVYWSLPPAGNPFAVNKYRISYHYIIVPVCTQLYHPSLVVLLDDFPGIYYQILDSFFLYYPLY